MAYLTLSNGSIFEGRRIQLLIYPKKKNRQSGIGPGTQVGLQRRPADDTG